MGKEDGSTTGRRVLRLAYGPELVDPLLHRFRSVLRGRPGLRVLFVAEEAGEPYYLAQRLANELGRELVTLDARRALRLGEPELKGRLARVGRARAVLLIEEAEHLLGRRGTPRAANTRAGANAQRILQALRRRRRPTLLATTATGGRLAALGALVDVCVAFGARRDGAEAELDRPHVARNFRVEVAGRELACSEVRGLALSDDDDATPASPQAKQAPATSSASTVLLRRALGPSRELFAWRQAVARGQDDRRDVVVRLLDAPGGEPVASWRLAGALAVRWTGPELDALASELAMESLELRYEALEWL